MGLHHGTGGANASRREPIIFKADAEDRRLGVATRLATGTLACPRCDAPIALTSARVSPADPLACPFCGHAEAVRNFLSLALPARPARVRVSVHAPSRRVDESPARRVDESPAPRPVR